MSKELNKLSKTMSYYLRHNPEELGIILDQDGWTEVSDLLTKLQGKQVPIDLLKLETIVSTDNKGRYTIKDGKIRANQGHSTEQVNVTFKEENPPEELYHGTSVSSWEVIKSSGGLKPMSRHYVHLSPNLETAKNVASRRKEKIIILKVKAQDMAEQGYKFYLSDNGVWLTLDVPIRFIQE